MRDGARTLLAFLALMVFYDFTLHVYDLAYSFGLLVTHPLAAFHAFYFISDAAGLTVEQARQVFWTWYWGLGLFVACAAFALYRADASALN